MPTPDRLAALSQQDAIVGIDFVYVDADQQTLRVFFHPNKTQTADTILGPVAPGQIVIHSSSGGETTPLVPVTATPSWTTRDHRTMLKIHTAQPGDFSRYRLRIDEPGSAVKKMDPFFNDIPFSFKANCPTLLDCEAGPHECPPEARVDFPVNYLARDFWSFRQVLLDFASERHPAWQDRGEADLGMLLLEVMSALADELAYYQDAVAREAFLETATQRRSIRRHARLVDYQLHDGAGARTWLDFQVSGDVMLHSGIPVRDRTGRVVFETGFGLSDGNLTLDPPLSRSAPLPPWPRQFDLRALASELTPHSFDEHEICLPVGSISLVVSTHRKAELPLDAAEPDFAGKFKPPGRWVLLRTAPADASVPARAWKVRLVKVTDEKDALFGNDVTRLEWEPAQATPFELEYATLKVRGNLVPATAGETRQAFFQVEPASTASLPPGPPTLPSALYPTPTPDKFLFAVERVAPSLNEASPKPDDELHPSRFLTLGGSEERDLVWLSRDVGSNHPEENAMPEVRVFQGSFLAGTWTLVGEWQWKRSLLGVDSSGRDDPHFTLDDGAWRQVARFRRVDETGELQEFVHSDYASGRGATVRFGNGEFGRAPMRGTQFRIVYRLGNGRRDNVAADTLTAPLAGIDSVTNPFPVTDAVAPQTAAEALQVAPEAFRALTFRAVRPEDYAEAVERLAWVQRAGAQFRWTGSWLTLFATPDPRDNFTLDAAQRRELERRLDQFRMVGREAHGRDPQFANLELEIHVCVARSSYKGEVEATVLEVLFGRRGVRPHPGFFSPDNWTFGTPLQRARLEAAIQAVPGVRAVGEIFIRRRGWFVWRPFSEPVFSVGEDEVIRVENTRELPERGAVRLIMEGGA